MDEGQTADQAATRAAERAHLCAALGEYVLHLARARHFAHHPDPRPTDAARSDAHFAAARRAEPALRGLLERLGASPPAPAGTPAAAGVRGLTFGIGGPAGRIGAAPGADAPRGAARLVDGGDRLARRSDVAAAAERYLRLLDRARPLAARPLALDTDAEAAAGQLAAARRAEDVLREELAALTK